MVAGGSAFSPADLANIIDWGNAADLTTDGEGIIRWTGREGNIVLAQNTASAKPQVASGATDGGNDAADFDGGDFLDDLETGGSFLGGPYSQPNTICLLFAQDVITGGQNLVDGSNSTQRHNFRLSDASPKRYLYAGTLLSDNPTHDTDWHTAIFTFDTTSSIVEIDGTEVMTGNAGSQAFNGMTLGSVWQQQNGDYWNGKIAYWIAVASALTAGEKSDVRDLLGAY